MLLCETEDIEASKHDINKEMNEVFLSEWLNKKKYI